MMVREVGSGRWRSRVDTGRYESSDLVLGSKVKEVGDCERGRRSEVSNSRL